MKKIGQGVGDQEMLLRRDQYTSCRRWWKEEGRSMEDWQGNTV